MKLIGNVHVVAGDETSIPSIREILAENDIETRANADIDIRVYPQFLVGDARALTERALTKSFSGGRRVFITVTPNLTYEAQNTMLKTLEEPAGDALFFFVVPSPETLLPTVRSRAQMLSLGHSATPSDVDIETFLKTNVAKRLDILKPLLVREEDDVRDISGAIAFLSGMERALARRVGDSREGLEAVYRARKYIGDKGSLLKSLLE